jgi:biotin transport system substrate-specific component
MSDPIEEAPMSQGATALESRRELVLADLLPGLLVRDVLLVIGSAALVGILAQVSIPLSFTPVPITGQTLGVLLAGSALGWRRAGISLSLYLVAGLAGLPWFIHHSSGWQGASTGYLFGFILAALACGAVSERKADRTVITTLLAMFAGEFLIYLIGVPWLAVDIHVSLTKAIALGLTPFLAGDAIKAGIVSLALPATWRLVGRNA